MNPLSVLVGLLVGAPLGMFVLALCMAARKGDRQQAQMIDLTHRRRV